MSPNVSAQAYAFGPHDLNSMPLSPLGCAIKINENPIKRRTWAVHSVDGWYLVTSPKHYQCYDVWVKGMGAVRITDTVFFKQKHITNPTVTLDNAIVHVAKELTEALKGNIPTTLEGISLENLAKLETIVLQQAKQYKATSKVGVQPPRFHEEHVSPPRVEITRTIQQTQPVACEPV